MMLVLNRYLSLVFLLSVLTFSTLAAQQGLRINEIVASNATGRTDSTGNTEDWIELYNADTTLINLAGYRLTDDPLSGTAWVFPELTIAPQQYLLVWASGDTSATFNAELHANFRVSSGGESIALLHPDGTVIDQSPATALPPDHSLGRKAGPENEWFIFDHPTPLAANDQRAYRGWLAPPVVSAEGGFYSDSFTVTISSSEPLDSIRFTLDGPVPTEEILLHDSSGILIDQSTVLRAVSFRDGYLPSPVVTNTYLLDTADYKLPVVSLAFTPGDFFGSDGLYESFDPADERAVHLEYFRADRTPGFEQTLGVRNHARDASKQKSLRLYARSEYGKKEIEYPLFQDLDFDKFKRLVLRNGGNDGSEKKRLHLKDGYAHELYRQLDSSYAYAAYQPVHVFLNGGYFGIYNLRERQDEHYLKSHTGFECDEVDFLEYDFAEPLNKKTICGDWVEWENLKRLLIEKDLAIPENYDTVAARIDLDNFIDYQLLQVFIGNQDWLNNNIKFWRPRTEDGKWKWVLWDTEYGMGTQVDFDSGQPEFNFVRMAMTWGGWGNGDWTWMLRNLMDNPDFRRRYITRYADLLNTAFSPEFAGAELDRVVNKLEPDLPFQLGRWGASRNDWEQHYNHTLDYMLNRARFTRQNLAEFYDLHPAFDSLTVDVSRSVAGRVRVNSITIDESTLGWSAQPYPFTGLYTRDYPVEVVAIPNPGYRFVRWEGDTVATDSIVVDTLAGTTQLIAIFERETAEGPADLLVNELMSSNASSYTDEGGAFPDWFEIYNPSAEAVNMAGLYLSDDRDEPDKWQIPATNAAATTVQPDGYLTFFADGDTLEGELHVNFRLRKEGEYLSIYADAGDGTFTLIDSIGFPELETDQSYGRLPNGGPDWRIFRTSTPDAINQIITSTTEVGPGAISLNVYPNPAAEFVRVELPRVPVEAQSLRLYNGAGQVVLSQSVAEGFDPRMAVVQLPAGLYLVALVDDSGRQVARGRFLIAR